MSWEQAWQEGRTGWDAGGSAPILRELVGSAELGAPGRALVPGCGAGYDVLTLADGGWEVTGLDLAPTAAKRFRDLAGERDDVDIIVGDFFEADIGPFDLIWDYTFLCAIQPDEREAWVERMHGLLEEDGRLVTLIFPITEERSWDEGPPFRMSPDLVENLVEERFEAEVLRPVKESHPGREGMEWLGIWRPR